MATVTIKHVTKAFGDNVVLKEFNETFQEGEFITLLTFRLRQDYYAAHYCRL